MPDYADLPTVQFAIFKNKYATTDNHPEEVGELEMTREFMKALVEKAKTGSMPVLRMAMWNNTSKAGMPYKNFKVEIKQSREAQPVEVEEEDDGLNF